MLGNNFDQWFSRGGGKAFLHKTFGKTFDYYRGESTII